MGGSLLMTEDGNFERSYLVPVLERIKKLEKGHTYIVKNQIVATEERKRILSKVETIETNTSDLVTFTKNAKVLVNFATVIAKVAKWFSVVVAGCAAAWLVLKAIIDWIPTHILGK